MLSAVLDDVTGLPVTHGQLSISCQVESNAVTEENPIRVILKSFLPLVSRRIRVRGGLKGEIRPDGVLC